MGDFKHLILTRFNLALDFGDIRRHDTSVPFEKPWLDEKYLERRFEIFEKYTFTSFCNQTDPEFEWIVMFHEDTPERFKKKIYELKKKLKQFSPIFFNDEQCSRMAEELQEYINKNYGGQAILTTRIDNDDAAHATFVERVKGDIRTQKNNTVLTYVNGLQYAILTKDILNYDYINNHFLSLYVDEGENGHILMYNHFYIVETAHKNNLNLVCKKTNIPLWVEIITENNFSNALRWRFRAIMVSHKMKKEYPMLELPWDTQVGWLMSVVAGVLKVFYYRGKGLLRIIFKKVKRG